MDRGVLAGAEGLQSVANGAPSMVAASRRWSFNWKMTTVTSLLFLNLCVSSTVIPMGWSLAEQSTREAELINGVLNLLPVALILFLGWHAERVKLVPGLAMMALTGVFLISNVANALQSRRIIGCALFLVMLVFAISRPGFLKDIFLSLIKNAHWFAIGFGGLVFLLNLPVIHWNFVYLKSEYEDNWFSLPFRNPNLLSVQLDVVVLLLGAAIVLEKRARRRGLLLALLVGITNLILGTVSRGGIVQLLAVWLIVAGYLAERVTRGRRVLRWLLGLPIMGTLLFGAQGKFGQHAWEAILDNFVTERNHEAYLTRRTTLDAIYQIAEDPWKVLFGQGAGNGGFAQKYFWQAGGSSHNSFVDIVAQFGMPFFVALAVCFCIVFWKVWVRLHHVAEYRFVFFLLVASMIHPMFEAVYFFRFAVTPDIVRLSLLAFLVWQASRQRGDAGAVDNGTEVVPAGELTAIQATGAQQFKPEGPGC